jgi:hypothetical protein
MKFAVKKAGFHKKFHFWTRAINQIQNFCKKKISSNSIKNYFGRGYSSNNSMSSPGHSREELPVLTLGISANSKFRIYFFISKYFYLFRKNNFEIFISKFRDILAEIFNEIFEIPN